jgi:hypothetical protein
MRTNQSPLWWCGSRIARMPADSQARRLAAKAYQIFCMKRHPDVDPDVHWAAQIAVQWFVARLREDPEEAVQCNVLWFGIDRDRGNEFFIRIGKEGEYEQR